MVSTFYNMVTDIYEWGWGHSFHFSPWLPDKSFHTSQVGDPQEALQTNLACVCL